MVPTALAVALILHPPGRPVEGSTRSKPLRGRLGGAFLYPRIGEGKQCCKGLDNDASDQTSREPRAESPRHVRRSASCLG